MTLRRLDAELVRRGLARSRESAQDLIAAGHVLVGGAVASKPATRVDEGASIKVDDAATGTYVSRGAHKLLSALDRFASLDVSGRMCLDAGASTGGFTQVLLERGAQRVLAVDVGYGQLAWQLRSDPRVELLERTNVRTLVPAHLPFRPDLVVSDLSFIPLGLVLPALSLVAAPTCDMLLMVKPQFEVGRADIGDGVVRDPRLRVRAVSGVAHTAIGMGFAVVDVVASGLPGPRGNVEYFVWLTRCQGRMGTLSGAAIDDAIEAAVREGPQ